MTGRKKDESSTRQKRPKRAEPQGGVPALVGRPDGYRPEYAAIAHAMCRLGATDFDLAQEFNCTTPTIWRWRSKHGEFFNATMAGREVFDDRVERALAMRAVGYSYHSEKVFQFEGQVVRAQVVEHLPPDTNACRFWLMNRRPEQWREKQEVKLDSSDAFLALLQAISDGTATAKHGDA